MNRSLALPMHRARTAPYGTRAQMATTSGDVEGYLAFAGYNRKAHTASYALRVVNQSRHVLSARMSCARLRGAPMAECPLELEIGPFSVAETLLPVRLRDVGPYDRAIVKIAGAEVAFSLEAPAPPRLARKNRSLPVLAAAVAISVACGVAAAQAQPRVGMFAAPTRAFAGSTLDVPYAYGGWASMRYALQTPDGRQIDAGLSNARQGTLHFRIPPAAGNAVVLLATVSGPFGSSQMQRQIQIANSAPRKSKVSTPPPHIDALSIASPSVRAGDTLAVKYVTNATSGEVWLIDPAGKLWAKADLTAYGQSTLKVPEQAGGQQMRVVLHAHKGSADATSSIGVLVTPQEAALNSASSVQLATSQSVTLALSTQNAAPGEDIVVTVNGPHGDARISLTDATGNTIETGDVPSGQNAVTLQAPSVATATTYYVIASVSAGSSEQSLVKKLTVTPR